MAHSIEARVPFLDYRIPELTFGLPAADLAGDGLTKLLLRRALADVLPSVVRERSRQARLRHTRSAILPRLAGRDGSRRVLLPRIQGTRLVERGKQQSSSPRIAAA